MGTPTHVQVIIKRAKNLKIKGKDGTNNAFVIIGLGKEKYRTSVKEKTTKFVEWFEECELMIPRQGNAAEIMLKVMHQGNLGSHRFLGIIQIPLSDFGDMAETVKPSTKWWQLKCKPGQNKTDYRGELEVTISFLVKTFSSMNNKGTSLLDLNENRKSKGSLVSLNKYTTKLGGSLVSLGHQENRFWKKKNKGSTHSLNTNFESKLGGSFLSVNSSCCSDSLENLGGGEVLRKQSLTLNPSYMSNAVRRSSTPTTSQEISTSVSSRPNLSRVNSQPNKLLPKPSPSSTLTRVNEEEDEWGIKLSSTEQTALNVPKRRTSSTIKDFIIHTAAEREETEIVSPIITIQSKKDCDQHLLEQHDEPKTEMPPPKPPRVVIGKELSRIEDEVSKDKSSNEQMGTVEETGKFLNSFKDKSREDLIAIVVSLERKMEDKNKEINELEEYVANLLLKVINVSPQILEAS